MTTILMRLSAPLQSWGESARFNLRPTQQAPTKSGVIGLVCAAMGISREDTKALEQLNQLTFGVRVDRPGQLLIDFHTVSNVVNAEGKIPQATTPTDRYYLCNAVFLVGFEGNRLLLESINRAILKPRWLLSLGRKSCMPSESIWLQDGLVEASLERALREHPPLTQNLPSWLELEDSERGDTLQMDSPLHFGFGQRQHSPRLVRIENMEEA